MVSFSPRVSVFLHERTQKYLSYSSNSVFWGMLVAAKSASFGCESFAFV